MTERTRRILDWLSAFFIIVFFGSIIAIFVFPSGTFLDTPLIGTMPIVVALCIFALLPALFGMGWLWFFRYGKIVVEKHPQLKERKFLLKWHSLFLLLIFILTYRR